jgi:hypothetical protein
MKTLIGFQLKGGPPVLLVIGALGLLVAACSGGGGSANLSNGSGATLSDSKSSVEVPTGSYEGTVNVSLNENQADTKDIGNVLVISNPVTLEFSKALVVQSTDPINLRIQLDAEQMRQAIADGKGIYAKVRVRGEQVSYDRTVDVDAEWMPLVGNLDPATATLTVRLYASAAEVDVAAVAGDELFILAIDPAVFNQRRSVKVSKSAKSAISVTKAAGRVAMAHNPWAIVCIKPKMSDRGAGTCDGSNVASLVVKVQDELTEASRDLNNRLQMNFFVIQQLTARELAVNNLSSRPVPEILRQYDPSVVYNVAYLSSGCGDSRRSCYDGTTGTLTLAEGSLTNAHAQLTGSSYHHELTHAVQTAIMPNNPNVDVDARVSRNSALVEGTATAVGLLAGSGWNTDASKGRLVNNVARNWADPLGKYSPYDDTYYMTEFFSLANSGDLSYLMPLFHSFNGNSDGVFHRRLNTAISIALGEDLPNVFLKRVMPLRNAASPNGVHYQRVDVTNNDIDHSISTSVKSMASHQYLFQDTNDEDICINVNLFQGADPNLALVMLNGTEGGEAMHYGSDSVARIAINGDVLTVEGHLADVQVINLSTGGIADQKNYTIAAYTDGACLPDEPNNVPCNPMKVYCGSQGCGLYVQAPDGRCWARAVGCDAQGRCTRPGFEGGFDFGSCENLKNQMTQNIPVGDNSREDPANLPEDRRCGDVELGCRWMVLCAR